MDERCRILIVTALLAVATLDVVAHGPQDDAPSSRQTNSARPHTLLVLVDGKVLRGRLVPRPDGYDVSTTSGRVFISSDRVRFTASDLDNAYRLLRETQVTRTPEGHMELAHWCLTNKLHDDARREVLDALLLDPNRGDAKRLLAALEAVSQSRPVAATGRGQTNATSVTPTIINGVWLSAVWCKEKMPAPTPMMIMGSLFIEWELEWDLRFIIYD